jgi:hypothetical protein
MSENMMDRLISSLSAGLINTDEFIDAIECRVSKSRSADAGYVAALRKPGLTLVPRAE